MTLISIIINCDTRSGFKDHETSAGAMFNGCRSVDFLLEGVKNKIKFFEGFNKEVIVHIDEHETTPSEVISELRLIADTVLIRKHTDEPKFNDNSYVRAMQLASGDIIAKFDSDCAAFTSSPDHIKYLIELLDDYKYVSYPSHWSPEAVHDPTFNYRWVSTRFFLCKRETLNFPEIRKCLDDYEYFCNTYKPSRVCPWTEHALGLIANSSVLYPPIELEKYSIFCWGKYRTGTLKMLNEMNYEGVKEFIKQRGIDYPCDINS
jgi:hypothetical protein